MVQVEKNEDARIAAEEALAVFEEDAQIEGGPDCLRISLTPAPRIP